MPGRGRRILGSRFRRHEIEQIHATLVGLERDEPRAESFLNRNYKVHERAEVQMDLRGLIDHLRSVRYAVSITDRRFPGSIST